MQRIYAYDVKVTRSGAVVISFHNRGQEAFHVTVAYNPRFADGRQAWSEVMAVTCEALKDGFFFFDGERKTKSLWFTSVQFDQLRKKLSEMGILFDTSRTVKCRDGTTRCAHAETSLNFARLYLTGNGGAVAFTEDRIAEGSKAYDELAGAADY